MWDMRAAMCGQQEEDMLGAAPGEAMVKEVGAEDAVAESSAGSDALLGDSAAVDFAPVPHPTSSEGFFERVYEMVEQIPCGMVATYGQIAALVGAPRRARYVGFALHANPRPGEVPCHRVVFADGRLSEAFAFGGENVQRRLLEDEGVGFLSNGKVDLAVYRWPAGL